MPMNEPEEGFEQYLRQFRPVMPCALSAPPRRSVPWGALAVAAAMLVVIGVAVLRHNLSPVLTPGDPAKDCNPLNTGEARRYATLCHHRRT
jgi:hypothetical protein